MMVIFTSQSDKKALKTTRWILDAFAQRIGNDTWQTIITEDGVQQVKSLLRRHATKSMSVSCRWIRSRSRCDLLWIVGDRSRFSEDGTVPVNYTSKDIMHGDWENDWVHLPKIQALAAVAGLLHDWGKANSAFQKKLTSKAKDNKAVDAYRHELISCHLLAGLVDSSGDRESDEGWMSLLSSGKFTKTKLNKYVNAHLSHKGAMCDRESLGHLPPIASMVCWLIFSHHLLPHFKNSKRDNKIDSLANKECQRFDKLLEFIEPHWGYKRVEDNEKIPALNFSDGLLEKSVPWQKGLKRWLGKLQAQKEDLLKLYDEGPGQLHLLLLYARIALMLADYHVSSQDAEQGYEDTKLYANTVKTKGDDGSSERILKQKLDEHLVRVAAQAAAIVHALPGFAGAMGKVEDVPPVLRKKSPSAYKWQDKAVDKITAMLAENKQKGVEEAGCFVVNMAGTGCGKTFANAKVMRALSEGGNMRYVLALGLRTLTLQTGDEYRQRIGLKKDNMAVLIGSNAIRQLYEDNQKKNSSDSKNFADDGDTEKLEELPEADVDYDMGVNEAEYLDVFLDKRKATGSVDKNRALLYAPVLVATIDHMMPATETIRGGRHLLPLLRLMSSDLVIDEVDDFTGSDLTAIARLVHTVGLFGRKVVISSATIPPDLAQGLFTAYQDGYAEYARFFGKKPAVNGVWIDEFTAKTALLEAGVATEARMQYKECHLDFVRKRIGKLQQQIVQRRGKIIECGDALGDLHKYYEIIQNAIMVMHENNYVFDQASGKRVSIGLVRIANIKYCVWLGQHLIGSSWPENYAPRLTVYHSRQTLLLRHEQEAYLDGVLKRKDTRRGDVLKMRNGDRRTEIFQDAVMREHIESAEVENIIFLVIATPVEEVGRDHDFDWAIAEPSSMRSLIQLAGRVMRHRLLTAPVEHPNIGILQYNVKSILPQKKDMAVFCRPGFEEDGTGNRKHYRLASHDIKEIADVARLEDRIDAVPRISYPKSFSDWKLDELETHRDLAVLEHKVMERFNNLEAVGAAHLHGWQREAWWMTGIPQKLKPFREKTNDKELYLGCWERKLKLYPKDSEDSCGEMYSIHCEETEHNERFWLQRDYRLSIEARMRNEGEWGHDAIDDERLKIKLCQRYGAITLTVYETNYRRKYIYSDQYGLYEAED